MELDKVRSALSAAVFAIEGSPREGQIEMAEAVANALSDRHHLLVQAGTGTGKSLAYLVPALVHGKKVLVATATLALQRQLVERDLPRVKDALEKELKRSISFAVYKGVGNYLCLQKMNADDGTADSEVLVDISSLEKDARRLREWAAKPGISGELIVGSGSRIPHLDVNVLAQMNVDLEVNVSRSMQKPKPRPQISLSPITLFLP